MRWGNHIRTRGVVFLIGLSSALLFQINEDLICIYNNIINFTINMTINNMYLDWSTPNTFNTHRKKFIMSWNLFIIHIRGVQLRNII